MEDQYGRNIDYLRISITDRCNFRCWYCMPEEGVAFIEREQIMTYEEILRVCRIVTGLGIRKIKITGGEPLVRKGACELIGKISKIQGIDSVTLTTNGMLLSRYLPELKQVGISGINVSLDTLERKKFTQITRRDCFLDVMDGIRKAVQLGLTVKINCVPMRGINEEELANIAALARESPLQVRFIEMMPIGMGITFDGILQEEIKRMLENKYGTLSPIVEKMGNGPARYYHLFGFQGNIGFISAVSHEFCLDCNRIRLTSDGILKPCLNYESHINIKQAMRNGADDKELTKRIYEGIYEKPRCHDFGKDKMKGAMREKRRMAAIGG